MELDLNMYKKISTDILISFAINFAFILILNLCLVQEYLIANYGSIGAEIIKQFFYGAIGATIACSLFLSKDKGINEIESLKDKPNKELFRLPDSVDRILYLQRIISSGVLACLGMLILLAGFSYLEINYSGSFDVKQKFIFAIVSLLIGLYQSKFLSKIEKLFENMIRTEVNK